MASPNVPLNLLPSKLSFNKTVTNYQEWKGSALYLIQRQGLIGLIDGSYSYDPSGDETVTRSPGYDVWRRIDEPLMHGILSLLEKEVAEVVQHLNTSRKIWLELETIFQKKFDQDHTAGQNEGQHIIMVRDWKDYYPLLQKAILTRDWDTTKKIFDEEESAMATRFNSAQSTTLHLAVEPGKGSNVFVKELVDHLPDALLAAKDAFGNTALSIAVFFGNHAAAHFLLQKNPDLVYIPNNLGDYPVHIAAKSANSFMLKYLISFTKDDRGDQNPYAGLSGLALLILTIQADSLDVALYLVKKYPYLATLKLSSNSALKSIAEKKVHHVGNELLTPIADRRKLALDATHDPPIWRSISSHTFEPGELDVLTRPTLVSKILNCLLQEMKSMRTIEAEDLYRDPILIAAKLDNVEVVEQIVEAFPDAIYCSNPASFQNISHVAMEHRSIRVLIFICRRIWNQHQYFDLPDINGNTILHLAAKLAPSHVLTKHSNPAIMLEKEVRSYKAVEKKVRPHSSKQLNHAGKSPRIIFQEEHENLTREAENWVKSTINSFSITAALISTISFAAAITVPGGGNPTTGFPLFGKNSVFTFFAVSDAISLIASATSLVIFHRISHSRCANEDFLIKIHYNVSWGSFFLKISIIFMMFAFSATLYLVFGHKRKWVLILTVIVAVYILLLFIFLRRRVEKWLEDKVA